MESQKERREVEGVKTFEEIIWEKISILIEDISLQIPKAQQAPSARNTGEATAKSQRKRENLQRFGTQKTTCSVSENHDVIDIWFLTENQEG